MACILYKHGYDHSLNCPYCKQRFSLEDLQFYDKSWTDNEQECPHCEAKLLIEKTTLVFYEVYSQNSQNQLE